MAESDLLKNNTTVHHGKHHGTTVPEVQPKDGNSPLSKPKHEDDQHGDRKKINQRKERKTKMNSVIKNRIALPLTALAFSIVLLASLQLGSNDLAVCDLNNNDLGASVLKSDSKLGLLDNDLRDDVLSNVALLDRVNDDLGADLLRA